MARSTEEVPFDRGAVSKVALFLLVVKFAVGLALIICAAQGLQNTKADKKGYGPPYWVGGFVCGPMLLIGCLFDGCVMNKARNLDADSQTDRSAFRSTVCPESVFAVLATFGAFPGFFCVSWGVKSCEVEDSWLSTCNYTINVAANRRLALFILVGLVLTVGLGIFSLCFVCCSPMLQGVRDACRRDGNPFYGNRRPRGGVTVVRSTYVFGGDGGATRNMTGYQPNVIYHPTATAGGSQTITTVGEVPPPVGGGVNVNNSDPDPETARMKRLEEENRLLREQLELRQQLGQQQQQQQPQPYYAGGPSEPVAPPPSYSEVVTQPEKSDQCAPSAPPMYSGV